jgi:hypothetical protein
MMAAQTRPGLGKALVLLAGHFGDTMSKIALSEVKHDESTRGKSRTSG